MFAGKPLAPTSSHPVGKILQHRQIGGLSGRRYGSFEGRASGGLSEWFLAGVEELPFVANLSAEGDFALGALVEQQGTVALVADIEAFGEFSFGVAVPPTPGSRFIGPRVGLRANGELIILF